MIQFFRIPNDKVIRFEILLGNVDVVILDRIKSDLHTLYEIDSDEMDKLPPILNELEIE
jgi:hypothetical protein